MPLRLNRRRAAVTQTRRGQQLFPLAPPCIDTTREQAQRVGAPPKDRFRSPLEADDIRHDMGLVDDLLAQAQRVIAEAADVMWLTESSTRSVLHGLLPLLERTPAPRGPYLSQLRDTVGHHLEEVFAARRDMDRIHEHIGTIQARPWDPKRNLPYCACRPRRDVLEDDVTHLMERVHEAGDDVCTLRERLLGSELENLTLKFEDSRYPGAVATALLREGEELARENKELQDRVLALRAQLGRPEQEGLFIPSLEKPLAPRAPSYYAPALGREAEGVPPAAPERRRAAPKRMPSVPTTTEKVEKNAQRLRSGVVHELDRHEQRLLALQKALDSADLPPEWQGFRTKTLAQMAGAAKDLDQLLTKLDRRMAHMEDLGVPRAVSMELQHIAEDAVKLDMSKLSRKEQDLLLKIADQAEALDRTSKALRRVAERVL